MIEVTYVDHMGTDLSVVNAARVSFGKKSELECIDLVKGKYAMKHADVKLIKYLAKHKHKSPFNHAFATFHVKAPIFVARQLVKHEYMPWNEISRRYVDEEPEFYTPPVWRGRSADKKQGSDGEITTSCVHDMGGELIHPKYAAEDVNETALHIYKGMIVAGVAPEQARMLLPQSMMTEWYWSGSLFAFAKMCSLRCKDDTQAETRVVADAIDEEMERLYPVSWEALMEYAE
jgi:thymidylate synthase (FAD)